MDIKNVFGTFFTAFLARQGTEELKAWTPRLTDKFIGFAVARLPVEERERFSEEWRSHVADVPGETGKLLVALGCILAAARISLEGRLSMAIIIRALDRTLGLMSALLAVPLVSGAEFVFGSVRWLATPSRPMSLFSHPPPPLYPPEALAEISDSIEQLYRLGYVKMVFLVFSDIRKVFKKRSSGN